MSETTKYFYDSLKQLGEVKKENVPDGLVENIMSSGIFQGSEEVCRETISSLSSLANKSTYEEFDSKFENELPAMKASMSEMELAVGGGRVGGREMCDMDFSPLSPI